MTTLDAAQKERDQLASNYRLAKKRQFEALFNDPLNGLKFRRFVATLNHFGADGAEQMISFVAQAQPAWLGNASGDMRDAALEAVRNRCIAIRLKAGLPEFDDPLPGDDDDVYRCCRKVMGL